MYGAASQLDADDQPDFRTREVGEIEPAGGRRMTRDLRVPSQGHLDLGRLEIDRRPKQHARDVGTLIDEDAAILGFDADGKHAPDLTAESRCDHQRLLSLRGPAFMYALELSDHVDHTDEPVDAPPEK